MAESADLSAQAAQEANRIAEENIEQQRRQEFESNRANLVFPEGTHGTIWVYNWIDPVARIGVHLANKGNGVARDLEMNAFVDGVPQRVERGAIARLTRDDRQDLRLLFQMHVDESWSIPENKLIRLQFNFVDGTGPREVERCFRFYGKEPQRWKSQEEPCT